MGDEVAKPEDIKPATETQQHGANYTYNQSIQASIQGLNVNQGLRTYP